MTQHTLWKMKDLHPVCCPALGLVSLCMFTLIRIVNTRLDALADVNRRRCVAVFPLASFAFLSFG